MASGSNGRKSDSNQGIQPQQPPTQPQPSACPECGSKRLYKDGVRATASGYIQRYLCRDCGYRFSCSSSTRKSEWNLNSPAALFSKRQVCDLLTEESKNLATVEPTKVAQREGTLQSADVKGKIVGFAWYLKKENYSAETCRTYIGALRNLMEAGADITDPDSVKEALIKYGEARKHTLICAYTLFLKTQGLTWQPPLCEVTRSLPFMPTERELDDLIAGGGRRLSAFLQTLKETAMRLGEAVRLKWINVDLQRRTIALNQTEKHGNPRIFVISNRLCEMLLALPRRTEYVFGSPQKSAKAASFYLKRKKLAQKLGNPRLLEIGFHSFRHWKATTLYHETKDIVLVKEFLGHRNIETTMLYI